MKFARGFAHGEVVRARRVNALLLAECAYSAGTQIRWHAHENARFVFVLRGSCCETCNGADHELTAGTLLFRPAGDSHRNTIAASGATLLLADLPAEWVSHAREQSASLDRYTVLRGGLPGHLAARLHGEFLQRDDVAPLAIEALLLGLVAETARHALRAADRKPPRWLEEARAMFHEQFDERLTLAVVAAAVGVHPVHLARSFRECYGCTPGDYLRGRRMDFVCRQVAASDRPLSEIALDGGFCDQSHFTRHFKRHTGLTPFEYRTLHRSRWM
jgi:AraC family transcriptional regulator